MHKGLGSGTPLFSVGSGIYTRRGLVYDQGKKRGRREAVDFLTSAKISQHDACVEIVKCSWDCPRLQYHQPGCAGHSHWHPALDFLTSAFYFARATVARSLHEAANYSIHLALSVHRSAWPAVLRGFASTKRSLQWPSRSGRAGPCCPTTIE